MEELEKLLTSSSTDLLSILPTYQKQSVKKILEIHSDYLEVADIWLNAKPTNTVGLGGTFSRSDLYRDKIIEELEKFLCGDEKYQKDRENLKASTDKSLRFIIGAISGAIGSSIGTAGAFILPVVVLILMNAGKITLNGWCEARKAIRANGSSN